jgi:hypothetical protein
MKIIFLDIDGVLNCEDAYHAGECQYQEWTSEDGKKEHHQRFCSWSKKLLNQLIVDTGAKVVISSTWRRSGIEWLRQVWKIEGMMGEIIGVTKVLRNSSLEYTIPRGCEIDKWLKDKGFYHVNWDENIQQEYMEKSGIENYIIIDDDSDMLYGQRNHFVHVFPSPRNKRGFNTEHYGLALDLLSKNVIDLNY